MWAARLADGYVFGGMCDETLRTLAGVPLLLESEDPRVLERLYPETSADEQVEADWRAHAVPELERLFCSRGVIVRKDLAAMRDVAQASSKVLTIPDGHVNAWLASLNAARLALYALNDLRAQWMGRAGGVGATEKQQEAIARIHLLAEIQSVLLGDLHLTPVTQKDIDHFVKHGINEPELEAAYEQAIEEEGSDDDADSDDDDDDEEEDDDDEEVR